MNRAWPTPPTVPDGPRLRGVALLFDALDRADRDPRTIVAATVTRARDDLARLGQQHAADGRFVTGLAWGDTALALTQRALTGETDPTRLAFSQLRRTA